jgi:hypothetical protein
MGNKNSYLKLSYSDDRLCILHYDIVYTSSHDFINGSQTNILKYYLPERNIGFHIYKNILYVYSCIEFKYKTLKKYRKKCLNVKLYKKILDIHKLSELKKIKSLTIINELKNMNDDFDNLIISV